MMPVYWTGISHPANGMILAPAATWRSKSGVFINTSSTLASLLDPFQDQLVHAHLHVDRIPACQAAGAETSLRNIDRLDQPFERQVSNGIGPDEAADFRHGHPGGDQLLTTGQVNSQVARPHHRRRVDPHVNLAGAGIT